MPHKPQVHLRFAFGEVPSTPGRLWRREIETAPSGRGAFLQPLALRPPGEGAPPVPSRGPLGGKGTLSEPKPKAEGLALKYIREIPREELRKMNIKLTRHREAIRVDGFKETKNNRFSR